MKSPPEQLAIDLPHGTALGRADFLVSECNRAALQWIERWPDWRAPALVLYGPPSCGKSHLARLWLETAGGVLVAGGALAQAAPDELARGGGVAVDDAEDAPEEALLHLYNCVVEARAGLLIVARRAPAAWPVALPDLASRLRALPSVAIAAPDDALLAALLVKHFADRQVNVAPAVIAFLVSRIERSFVAVARAADALDNAALRLARPITLPLARQVLAEAAV